MNVTSLVYDEDTGALDLNLDDGSVYQVTNPGHALRIKEKISPGGVISEDQKWWLEQYRVELRKTNRERLRERLKTLRREIREL